MEFSVFCSMFLFLLVLRSSCCLNHGESCILPEEEAAEEAAELPGVCKPGHECTSFNFTSKHYSMWRKYSCGWWSNGTLNLPMFCCPVEEEEKPNNESQLDEGEFSSTFCQMYNPEYLNFPNEDEEFERIVGGTLSKRRYPFLGTIAYHNDFLNSSSFKCGGALISRHHFLTAARKLN